MQKKFHFQLQMSSFLIVQQQLVTKLESNVEKYSKKQYHMFVFTQKRRSASKD